MPLANLGIEICLRPLVVKEAFITSLPSRLKIVILALPFGKLATLKIELSIL